MIKCNFEFLFGGSREKETYINSHNHNTYELVYYMKGSGSASINGVEYEYCPNSIAVIEPLHMHDEYHRDETYVIYILFSYTGNILDLRDSIFSDSPGNTVRHLLEEMKKEYYTKAYLYELKLDLLTEQLIIELSRICDKQKISINIASAIKYLNENYNKKINMRRLAEKSGYSYHHFRRMFAQNTGYSPTDYIIKQRIQNSKYLLKCTNLPISHVSQECGFSSESQFCCMFKKKVGQTPKTFRKETNCDSMKEHVYESHTAIK